MNPLDRTCDAFLDNRMSEAERARFEMRVVREPRLAAVVDLHREVGSSLRRSFETPDLSGLIGKIEADKFKASALMESLELSEAVLVETNVVVLVEVIESDDGIAPFQ